MKYLLLILILVFILSVGCNKITYVTNEYPIAASSPAPLASPVGTPVYLGCFSDNASRELPNFLIQTGSTLESCAAVAKSAGYQVIGLQYGGQCFAGNQVAGNVLSDITSCDMPCTADTSETCGGVWANSIYFVGE